MFEETVVTGNGIEKKVTAASASALAEGVEAAKAEVTAPQPDINVPAHGNMTDVEFAAAQVAVAEVLVLQPELEKPKRSHQKKVVEPVA